MQGSYLIPVSNYDVTAYNITFDDFSSNLNKVRSTGAADMTIGANRDNPSITTNATTNRVGVGSYYTGIDPIYDLEVAGTIDQNASIGLRGTGIGQSVNFDDNTAKYSIIKNYVNDFYLTGKTATHPYLYFHSGSGTFISDGFAYRATGLDSDVNLQLYATDAMRFSLDDNTNAADIDVTHSGFDSDSDFYFGYVSGANATSGSFFGLSGAVFVSNKTQNTRIGNIETYPDARLLVSNTNTDGISYKTLILEDENYANLYFRREGYAQTASITYNGTNSLHFGRSSATSTVSSTDGVILNLSNKTLGVGGVTPVYKIDATGSNSSAQRLQTSSDTMIMKYQSNYPSSSGPVDTMFTTYSSGLDNKFIVGYDFQNEWLYFQTGNTSNTYVSSRNTHRFYDSGDLDIKGSYTTSNNYCKGKFIQNYHTRCASSDIYINPLFESSSTSANASSSTESAFAIAPFNGKIKKIKILTADTALSDFTNGARFEISVVNPSSGGVDEQLDCFSNSASSAPTSLPSNGVVAQFAIKEVSSAGTVYTFESFSGVASFTEGQLIQYRVCKVDGSATSINSTIISSIECTVD
tara:strand:- start:1030 stop:2772 length:1743 start_codon:yes stop_codon:yes gene_type:complete